MIQATIANGQTTSSVLALGDAACAGLYFGTLTAATGFTLERSVDGTTFVPVVDPETGAARNCAVPATGGCYVAVELSDMLAARYVKVVMNEAVSAAVAVTAETYRV